MSGAKYGPGVAQIRCPVAAALGLVVGLLLSTSRIWLRWLVRLVGAGLVLALWPSAWARDRLTWAVSGGLDQRSEGTLTLDVRTTFAGKVNAGHLAQKLDLDDVVAELATPMLVLAVLLALVITAQFVTRVESGQPRLWWVHRVTRWRHVRRGQLPRELMAFLDDAHRLGLMRTVGLVYQFRHAELQDHLAASTSADGPLP
jgi:hypothetical protein